jgi:hypothetical protein
MVLLQQHGVVLLVVQQLPAELCFRPAPLATEQHRMGALA